jgi:hypothetical protein
VPIGSPFPVAEMGLARHEIKGETQVKPLLSLNFWVLT